MAASFTVKFDASSRAARRLQEAVFEKIKEIHDADLTDDAVAQFVVALVSRGTDRKRIHANLKGVLGEETTVSFLDWCVCCWQRRRCCGVRCQRAARPQAKRASRAHPLRCSGGASLPQALQAPTAEQGRAGGSGRAAPGKVGWGRGRETGTAVVGRLRGEGTDGLPPAANFDVPYVSSSDLLLAPLCAASLCRKPAVAAAPPLAAAAPAATNAGQAAVPSKVSRPVGSTEG